jgi:hypothetical protein
MNYFSQSLTDAIGIPSSGIEIINNNFLCEEFDWVWAIVTVVYACSTCYSGKQMESLMSRFVHLSVGCIVLLVDKEIRCENNSCDVMDQLCMYNCDVDSESGKTSAFTFLDSMPCKTTWGHATVNIYRKIV